MISLDIFSHSFPPFVFVILSSTLCFDFFGFLSLIFRWVVSSSALVGPSNLCFLFWHVGGFKMLGVYDLI